MQRTVFVAGLSSKGGVHAKVHAQFAPRNQRSSNHSDETKQPLAHNVTTYVPMHAKIACTGFEVQRSMKLATTLAFDTVGQISGPPKNNASTTSSLDLYSTYKNTVNAPHFFPRTLPQAWCEVVIKSSTPKKVSQTA